MAFEVSLSEELKSDSTSSSVEYLVATSLKELLENGNSFTHLNYLFFLPIILNISRKCFFSSRRLIWIGQWKRDFRQKRKSIYGSLQTKQNRIHFEKKRNLWGESKWWKCQCWTSTERAWCCWDCKQIPAQPKKLLYIFRCRGTISIFLWFILYEWIIIQWLFLRQAAYNIPEILETMRQGVRGISAEELIKNAASDDVDDKTYKLIKEETGAWLMANCTEYVLVFLVVPSWHKLFNNVVKLVNQRRLNRLLKMPFHCCRLFHFLIIIFKLVIHFLQWSIDDIIMLKFNYLNCVSI